MRLRDGARAIALDEADRILLVQFTFPDLSLWGTPGGGIDAGEGHEQAIIRELMEETGLEGIELGPWVWSRTHIFPSPDGRWDGQRDRFFLVRTRRFEPAPQFCAEELELEHVTAVRWWTQAELAASQELFAPRRLPELVTELLRAGPPHEPLDVGD